MGQQATDLGRARDAVGREAWEEAYALLHGSDEADLTAEDLDAFADAAWWLCRVEESIAARQKAYARYVAAGAHRSAGLAAWMLFFDHHLAGMAAVAAGWLRRSQRHLREEPECAEHGLLAYAEVDTAQQRGDLDAALAHAREMTDIGQRCHSPDMVAMGLQAQGRMLLAAGEVAEGFALLDEAMLAVVAGELSSLFTGWIFCLALGVVMEAADLRRAAEWTEAAMGWCESLPNGTPFHGLCRVHRVEVMNLRGAWAKAETEARRACDELLINDPRIAAEAFYAVGEIRQRMGDHATAEEAFRRAHELGRDPQPGLALLRLAQGRAQASAAALRTSLASGEWSHLGRSRLLAAQVEAALATGDIDSATAASAELESIARRSGAPLLHATAAMACGALELARQDGTAARPHLRRAHAMWLELSLPYEAARTRMLVAVASRDAGDHESARLELQAAQAVFERLGADTDARKAADLLGEGLSLPRGLTEREAEVLRLVAAGKTNRDIAVELVISQHTVARHLNNIFAKLGVSSRAAATAFAFTNELV